MASDSVEKFGSNTQPAKFGLGRESTRPWLCVCGNTNPGNPRWTKRGEEICQRCMQPRSYVEDK